MPKIRITSITCLAGIAVMALGIYPTHASAQDYDDPPSRVARIGYERGSVSFQPAGTQDWVDGTVNRPLTTGDRLWTDRGSRVALHIGSASINLSEDTDFSFLNLADNTVQIQLGVGSIRIRVKRLRDDENFEVDTPNLAFTILRPGIYRITVNDAGDSTVIRDRSGEGEVTGGGAAYTVRAGDFDTFTGTYQLNAYAAGYVNSDDDFERWCQERDHHEDISISARYVSDDAIGYDDLDDNGGWRPVPQYGMVWFPHTTVVGWAPYHYGHWAYIAPWGYTWVDDADWGFAPFHYGRWIAVGGSWGWVPCPPRPAVYTPAYVQPVYAPALVAWIGGPHFGISIQIGGGGIGWFPLGPREVYVPSYPVSRNYINQVNVSNTTVNTTVVNNYYNTVVVNKTVNITNVTYVNQRVPGAVAATTPQAFNSGQPVAHNIVHVDPREVASAPVVAMTPPAVPQRQSVFGGRAVAAAKPPAAVQTRQVVAKLTPPPPPPSFAQRQAAIQSNGGRPLSVAQVRQIAPVRTQIATVVAVKVAPPAKTVEVRNVAANRPLAQAPVSALRAPTPPEPVVHPAEAARPVAVAPAPPPPTAHPVNPQMEQRHVRQSLDLHKQQDLEYQQLRQKQQEQLQVQEQQKANAERLQQIEQQHQQQLQQLEKQHDQQLAQLQKQQEAEHQRAQKQQAAQEKPASKSKDERPNPK